MSSSFQLVPQNPRNQNCTGLVCDNEEKTREISLAVFQQEENKRASSFTHVFHLLIREQRCPAIFCAPVGRTMWSRERVLSSGWLFTGQGWRGWEPSQARPADGELTWALSLVKWTTGLWRGGGGAFSPGRFITWDIFRGYTGRNFLKI